MPSLFLFILFTNIILELDIKNGLKRIFKKNYSLIYIAIIGMFCGYPMGAKAVSKFYDKKEISYLHYINPYHHLFFKRLR